MSHDAAFLGRGWSFPPQFKRRGGVHMVSAEEDIGQSLRILLLTTPGERVMQPQFGCDLKGQLFAGINENTITVLKDLIRRAVLFFEPRVILENVEVDQARAYDGYLGLTLVYRVISTNTRHNLVFPYYFREGTDV